MTPKPTSFHVRHDLQPSLTYELLGLLLARSTPQTEKDLEHGAVEYGYRLRGRKDYAKLIKSLVELGIVAEVDSAFVLTTEGGIIARITQYQRDLLADFVHFLYYSGFDLDTNKRFSWSYRQVCDALWSAAPSSVDRDRLVNLVIRDASLCFEQPRISFSTSSIAGIVNWLVELVPSCIAGYGVEQRFTRRDYCSVELFGLALHHEYRKRNPSDSQYVPIDSQYRDNVYRMCLIHPEGFFEMLALAESNLGCVDVRRERGDRISMAKFNWSLLES